MASLEKWGSNCFVQWYEGEKQRRRSLETDSLQIAKEQLRRFESAQFPGDTCPLPTRTPVGEVIAAFIEHMQAHRPERSWRRNLSYLRASFGECCEALTLQTRREEVPRAPHARRSAAEALADPRRTCRKTARARHRSSCRS